MDKQSLLEDFHEKFGLTVNLAPTVPAPKDIELRINLIKEEADEFEEASRKGDIVGVADAIADLLYVVYGAAVTWGIPADKVFAEVHRSNLTKIWPDGSIKRREADGKIIKPPTYSPADIATIISNY
jgi:predicted HAD superfamily Cof-like phosphohydrolase